jgi:hypothetical protein
MPERKKVKKRPSTVNKKQYDYIPLTLSIELKRGIAHAVIPRGTPLPVSRSQFFVTTNDNQDSIQMNLFWGERAFAKDNIKIGNCEIRNITKAPRGMTEIKVTFDSDIFCNIKTTAVEVKSGQKIETTLKGSSNILTDKVIEQALKDAISNRDEDKAHLAIQNAESIIQNDRDNKSAIANLRKIERIIGELGTALLEKDKITITQKTKELEATIASPPTPANPDTGIFGNVLDSYFSNPLNKTRMLGSKKVSKKSTGSSKSDPVGIVTTQQVGTTAILQTFLEGIDPTLEQKRRGAWDTFASGSPDACTQSAHSMREMLRQLLDALAPDIEVIKAPWYKKPNQGSPVTRQMRIKYILSGSSVVSQSTISLTTNLADAVDSMYDKLSAESHSSKSAKITSTRMYLNACDAVIGLIISQKSGI